MGAPSVLSGADTINLNNRVFVDLAIGNCVEITFPNGIATVKTGKNGNAIFGLNETGRQADVKIMVLRGTDDDKFLNNVYSQQLANFAAFPLMIGEFIKKLGDGAGNITNDTYILAGGIIEKAPEAKMNVEGDVEQSVTHWNLKFANAVRVIT